MVSYFHITLSKSVSRIRRQGLRQFQSSNWVRAGDGSRFGTGELYAFENRYDALRWAARMDWAMHQRTGSGKVSLITFNAAPQQWSIDESDPLSQAGSRGRWLKSEHEVAPLQILSIVPIDHQALAPLRIADLLPPEE